MPSLVRTSWPDLTCAGWDWLGAELESIAGDVAPSNSNASKLPSTLDWFLGAGTMDKREAIRSP